MKYRTPKKSNTLGKIKGQPAKKPVKKRRPVRETGMTVRG